MATEAIYQEIRECVNYRIEQEEKMQVIARGLDYEQVLARLEAYRTVLDDLDASQANMEGSHA